MNIWTSKRSCLSFALVLALSACSGGEFQLPFGNFGSKNARPNVALVSAEMADGRVKLVPPDGFCIDKRGLQQNFAVLARCDSLGGRGGAQDASLGMITVALAPEQGDIELASALPALIPEDAEVLEQSATDTVAIAQISGPAPEGSDTKHWRGLTRMSGQLMSIAVYAPTSGLLAEEEGKQALTELADRSLAASDEIVAQAIAKSVTPQSGTGLRDQLRGLFNRKPLPE